MAWQNFVDGVGPVLASAWLNVVDLLKVTADSPTPITDGDTTPSVEGLGSLSTANTGSTSITTFDDGVENQIIEVLVTDANTTFVQGATLKTNTGSNVASAADRIYRFKLIGEVWYMF